MTDYQGIGIEKDTEQLLQANFDGTIVHSLEPSIFTTQSKADGYFINDRILIVFECKKEKINEAVKQLKRYKSEMKPECFKRAVYFVACSGTTQELFQYQIFDNEFQLQEQTLCLESFKVFLQPQEREEMNKNIVHKIHDIIRENTKVSNEDKPLLIGAILLGVQIDSYSVLIKDETPGSEELAQILVDKISSKFKDADITNSLEFIKKSLDNKILFMISQKVLEIVKKYKGDVLGIFYTEFCKYQSTDSRSLGIVLTPPHIVKLMIQLLELKPEDEFLDLCTGTGSFLKEAVQKCKTVVGVEYQTKLSVLAKINMIICKKGTIYHADCFQCKELQQYKFNKSAINPPYGDTTNTEIKFILEQLKYIQIGGMCAAIVPENVFNASRNQKEKQQILEQAQVTRIIKCNSQLFFNAKCGVSVCIILLRKMKQGNTMKTIFQDYTDDGFSVKVHHGRKEKSEEIVSERLEKIYSCSETLEQKMITAEEDWKMSRKVMTQEEVFEKYIDLKTKELGQKCAEMVSQQLKEEAAKLNPRFQKFKFCDLFEYIGRGKRSQENEEGTYPIISASKENNGISSFSETFDFDGDYMTISSNGSAGYCFLQQGKFSATADIIICKQKAMWLNMNFVPKLLSTQLNQRYDFVYKLNGERLMQEEVFLPTNFVDFEILEEKEKRLSILYTELAKCMLQQTREQLENTKWFQYKISDIFEMKGGKQWDNREEGGYPFIQCSKENNGINEYVNKYNFEGEYITFAFDGSSAGYCFHQSGKFWAGHVFVLKLKCEGNLTEIAKFMTIQFIDKFDFVNKATLELLKEEIIFLPYELHPKEIVHIDWKKWTVKQLKEFTEEHMDDYVKYNKKQDWIDQILSVYSEEEVIELCK